MKTFRHVGLSILLFVGFASSGLAQASTITGTITTVAGRPLSISGAQATTQALDYPVSVAPDGAGGFYISSSDGVYRVAAGGTLTVIAGTGTSGFSGDGGSAVSAQLDSPQGVAVDGSGNLFIADNLNSRVRKVTAAGIITTVAGTGTYGFSGDGGPATSAELGFPSGVAVDGVGNLFIADYFNNRIRKVTAAGIITTVAGTGTAGFSGDGGPAVSAELYSPRGVGVDGAGNLFIADTFNDRIRKVTPAGIITTVAGKGTTFNFFGGDSGPATSAQLNRPWGVAADGSGNLYIADADNQRIRKVTPADIITTVAGSGAAGQNRGGFSGDGGPATSAQLSSPKGVAVDASGNLYIADDDNQRIRKVTPAGTISTVAGNGTQGYGGDGGPATIARLSNPVGVAVDGAGTLFIADNENQRIRKVTPNGVISTVVGDGNLGFSGDGGLATSAQLNGPRGVAVDESGTLFIADAGNSRIRKMTPDGVISTVAGNGTSGSAGDGGPATSAQLSFPSGVTVDGSGNLYIADYRNSRIRKVSPSGVISTVAGNGTRGFSGDGGPASSAQLGFPSGVTVDGAGNLFIADADNLNSRIRKVSPSGVISTVAGNGTSGRAGDGGPATSAQLLSPSGVAVDGAGNLFIADACCRIRKVSPDGVISTVAGNGSGNSGFSGDGGPATSALLGGPSGVAVDGAGNLFITDNQRVRKVTFAQQTTFTLVDRGGMSLRSSGTLPATTVGYASIQPNTGNTPPSGLAIFGFRQNNVLVTEAGVPASPLIQSGRIYAEINGPVNTGLAIANPNNQPATVSFFFTGENGNFSNGSTTIPANGQIAKFLNDSPFNGPSSLSGTFTFSSSVPIAVIALRGLTNERGEFLITTLPVADLSAAVASGTMVFPHFADGGGWTTQIVLVNTTDSALSGTVQFVDTSGRATTVVANSAYSIPARSSQKFQTSGAGTAILTGSVRVAPTANTATPSGLAIFSFRNGGITVAEAGVPAVPAGIAFRLYAEVSSSIQTGIAVANTSSNAGTVTLDLSKLDGLSTGLTGTLTVPANGQAAIFLNQVQGLGSLQTPFQGILRLSSTAPISVVGLRGRYNERNDFLITTTPPVNEAAASSSSMLFFPHIADSGGYTTQFILFSGQPGQASSGTIQLFNQSGGALGLTLQ